MNERSAGVRAASSAAGNLETLELLVTRFSAAAGTQTSIIGSAVPSRCTGEGARGGLKPRASEGIWALPVFVSGSADAGSLYPSLPLNKQLSGVNIKVQMRRACRALTLARPVFPKRDGRDRWSASQGGTFGVRECSLRLHRGSFSSSQLIFLFFFLFKFLAKIY